MNAQETPASRNVARLRGAAMAADPDHRAQLALLLLCDYDQTIAQASR